MNQQHENVDAVLMASGFSRRFGDENKLLMPFLGKPLLHYPLTLACNSGLFHRIFVVSQDAKVQDLANEFPVSVLHNPHPEHGSNESVRLGVQASDAAYYLFLPCDQPLLDLGTLQALLALKEPKKIVQPYFESRVGSPVLFSSYFKEELCSLLPNQPTRTLLKRHPQAVLRLPLVCEAPLLDVDTPQDLMRLTDFFRHSD